MKTRFTAVICILCILLSALNVSAENISEYTYSVLSNDDWEYIADTDNTVTISKYIGSQSEVEVPQTIDGKTVVKIGDSAFSSCTSVTKIVLPSTLVSIDNYAFKNCIKLTEIFIPRNVKSIASNVFLYCKALTAITVDSENSYFCTADGVLFDKDKTTLICFPPAKSGSEYTVPDSVHNIGNYAFYQCTNLKNIKMSGDITYIGINAFYATALYDNKDNWDNDVLYLNNCLIDAETDISGEYDIKSDTVCIADYAFYNCNKLTDINLPETVCAIGEYTFCYCKNLVNINTDDNSSVYSSDNGVLLSKDKTELICYPRGRTDDEYEIPDGITDIGVNAFAYCNNITAVKIPDSVINISDGAFSYCTYLSKITLPYGCVKLGDNAFYYCNNLTHIDIPVTLTHIGNNVFFFCYRMANITIPENVVFIGDNVFTKGNAGLVISGIPGSTAHIYAKQNHITFKSVVSSAKYGEIEFSKNMKSAVSDNDSGLITVPVSIESNTQKDKIGVRIYTAVYNNNDVLLNVGINDISVDGENGFYGQFTVRNISSKPAYVKVFAVNIDNMVSPLCKNVKINVN